MQKIHTKIEGVISYTTFKNRFGLTGLASSQRGLIRLANNIPNEKAFESILVKGLGFQINKDPKHFDILIKQFQKYFIGELKSFEFPLDLRLGTTATFHYNHWYLRRFLHSHRSCVRDCCLCNYGGNFCLQRSERF